MNKKYKKENDFSYSLGVTVTIELLKQRPQTVEFVYFHSQFNSEETKKLIKELCEKNNIQIVCNDKIFNVLSNKENCYVIGEFKKYKADIDFNQSQVVLVNPSNTGNLGTIIRSMLGFDIKNLAIIEPAVDIFDPKTIRASMGAVFNVNFTYFKTIQEYEKHASNLAKYSFMLDGKNVLQKLKKTNSNYALIFGNEASGLPDYYKKFSPVFINHSKAIDSLNLQTAVSIALYEFTK